MIKTLTQGTIVHTQDQIVYCLTRTFWPKFSFSNFGLCLIHFGLLKLCLSLLLNVGIKGGMENNL